MREAFAMENDYYQIMESRPCQRRNRRAMP